MNQQFSHNFAVCFIGLLLFPLVCNGNKPAPSSPVKTVVVLMLENRSFDHMLGWLKRVNPNVNGLFGNESNPVNPNDVHSPRVYVNDTANYEAPFDPLHSVVDTTLEIFGGPKVLSKASMDGFYATHLACVLCKHPESVMQGFAPEKVPIISTLAQSGALFDRFFASVPGPTYPNRLYAMSATSHGLGFNNKSAMIDGFPQTTLFESFESADLSWKIYFHDVSDAILFKQMRSKERMDKMKYYDDFKKDAREGKLANFTWINPRFFPTGVEHAQDQHPQHNVVEGERLLKEVYETLRASPQWNESALVIMYDEHGGFYDHVPTPLYAPSPDDINSPDPPFAFNRLGVRVPFIVVSPWVDNQIVHSAPDSNRPTATSEYDLSSLPATMKHMFGFTSFLTKRDAWASTFDHIFNRTIARADLPMKLPQAPKYRTSLIKELMHPISDLQSDLADLASAALNRERPPLMTEKDGTIYVREALKEFWKSFGLKFPVPPPF